jgi:hypothetical protein
MSVSSAYDKVSRLHLSAFGRGFAAAGYGVSRMYYRAEYSELPPAPVLARLAQLTARLVDRNRPAARAVPGPLPGVRQDLLPGRPEDGGFGAPPWLEHLKARHAVWAARGLASAGSDRPVAAQPP